MRVLALDWGEVRIGAAISDEEGKFAFPLNEPIPASNAITEIQKLISEKQVEKILVGNPKSLSGQESESSKRVSVFVEMLNQTGIPIELIDERFSTVGAEKILKDQGMKEKKQREIKDNIVAQQMLQQYLNK